MSTSGTPHSSLRKEESEKLHEQDQEQLQNQQLISNPEAQEELHSSQTPQSVEQSDLSSTSHEKQEGTH